MRRGESGYLPWLGEVSWFGEEDRGDVPSGIRPPTGSSGVARRAPPAVLWADMTGSRAGGAAFSLPVGTVAFLLTDVEGSTLSWEAEPVEMTDAIARHYEVLDRVVTAHRGVRPQEQGEGDSIVAAFSRASDAVLAAWDAQRALAIEVWPTSRPLRVRMAVHAGEAQFRGALNYAGAAITRTARLRAIGHGGQVLVSQAARDLSLDQLGDQVTFVDLGSHRLKDLARPEHVWQLGGEGLSDTFPSLRSLDAVPNNLPSMSSSFVGRVADVATVLRLVRSERLVSVTGSGGAGKTRLALAVAAEAIDQFGDGVWWVELAARQRGDAVAAAIGEVIGVVDDASVEPTQRLCRCVGAGAPLLVLDNAEHLVDDVARLVHELLARCPHVVVLVTSRRALEVPGEVTWRVPPLTLPSSSDVPVEIIALSQFDAVHLFLDRARNVRPGFALTDTNAAAVAEICVRLDGIPLAIELAAARCRSLAPRQVLEGLADALGLLTTGPRTVLPRQQTLAASIGWSHDLLDDVEGAVLRRLSVFADGCTLHAAERVVADGALVTEVAVLDVLDRLVQQSLLQVTDDSLGRTRYRLLETVRQFADHELENVGETAPCRARHATWILSLLEECGAWANDERVFDIWSVLEPELNNISVAVDELCATGRYVELADRLLGLANWSQYSCRYGLTLRWYRPLLTHAGLLPAATRAWFLARAGLAHGLLGQLAEASGLLLRASQTAQEDGDTALLAVLRGLIALGGTTVPTPGAVETAMAALDAATVLGDAVAIMTCRYAMVGVLAAAGRPARAAPYLAELWAGEVLPYFEPDLLLWEGTNARMAGAIHESLRHYQRLEQLTTRGGALPQIVARGGYALSAFEADLPDPDHDRLDDLARHAEADNSAFGLSVALVRVGLRALRASDLPEAERAFERARAAAPGSLWATWADTGLLAVHDATHDDAAVRDILARLRAIDHPLRTVIADLGEAALALDSGDHHTAENLTHRALSVAVEHGLYSQVPVALETLADAWSHRTDVRPAARLAGFAQRLRDDQGTIARSPRHKERLEATRARLAQQLDVDDLQTALHEGAALTTDQAIDYASRHRRTRGRPSFGWDGLTPTEQRVVDAVCEGLTNPQIASQLLVGIETVKTHLKSIYTKLGVTNRTQLAARARGR